MSFKLIVKNIVKKKLLLFIFLFYLLITPWFIQLLISGFETWERKPLIKESAKIINNLTINTSVDYLFFKGDPRVKFGNQETGPFYIYQFFLILAGFYCLFNKFNRLSIILMLWFFIGLGFASLFASPDFSNCLLYFLPLQVISFLGLVKILDWWWTKKLIFRIFIGLFFLLAGYEMIIYFHIMLVHYPKRLGNI